MIQIELMEGGIPPVREHSDDGGFDLIFPCDHKMSHPNNGSTTAKIGMKIKVLLPMGWTGLIRPRSSAYRKGYEVNGTIDRYTGEIFLTVRNNTSDEVLFEKGQSVAQLIPVWTGAGLTPLNILKENSPGDTLIGLVVSLTAASQIRIVKELPKTQRGDNGYGSTGKQ